ncbi:MAG: hypothetical protein C0598_11620 [Marinilabiliales bacterium]|nr:MAG: hypothetical protein C0598_11620 [Marinilabiliales bacterium]
MSSKIHLVLILIVSTLLFSCTQQTKSKKPRSIGNTSEIIVVVQNENQWDDTIGVSIKKAFAADQYGLNQSEAMFRLSHVKQKDLSDLLRKHHNLFVVNIDRSAKKPLLEYSDNLYSEPQSVYKLTASSEDEFVRIFNNNVDRFIQSFQKTDRDRILEVFRSTQNAEAVTQVKKKTGIKMVIPKDFYLAKDLNDFIWLRKEQVDMSQALFIISDEYIDTLQFSKESILSRIKTSLKNNVPGAVYNSYMSIDEEFIPPVSKVITDFPGEYAVEMTGAWKVVNDFMGGPFKAYTFYNSSTNKIVTIMGYVYKPNSDKRNLLKQVEAMIYSIKIEKK